MITSKIVRFLAAATLAAGFSTVAHAQTRTWVSGTGSDANPCSRTAPCQTFAGAFNKTATNGEISALDPGGFGTINITKSITLNGDGTLASILNAGTTGIIVNIATNLTTDKVVVRNVSIQGAGTGTDGVRIIDGQEVVLDDVTINGFTDAGVDITQSQTGNVFLRNVRISKGAVGVRSQSTAGTVVGVMENVHIFGMTSHGIQGVNNSVLSLRGVVSSRNVGDGIRSDAATVNIIAESTTVLGNDIGVNRVAGTIRIHDVGMYHNNTNCTTTVVSSGQNRSAGNTTTNNPTAGGFTIH
jgi:hypothetical protein